MPNKQLYYTPQKLEILTDAYGYHSRCGQCRKKILLIDKEFEEKFFICEKCGFKNYIHSRTEFQGLGGWLLVFYFFNLILLTRNIFLFFYYYENSNEIFGNGESSSPFVIVFGFVTLNIIARFTLSILYFTKDELIPKLLKLYCIVDIILSLIIFAIYYTMWNLAEMEGDEFASEAKQIWIENFIFRTSFDLIFFWYLMVSKKVKSTFTKRRKLLHPLY